MTTQGCKSKMYQEKAKIIEMWMRITGFLPEGTLVMLNKDYWKIYPFMYCHLTEFDVKISVKKFVGEVIGKEDDRFQIIWIGRVRKDTEVYLWSKDLVKVVGIRRKKKCHS